jgi:hypothetical protein
MIGNRLQRYSYRTAILFFYTFVVHTSFSLCEFVFSQDSEVRSRPDAGNSDLTALQLRCNDVSTFAKT